MAEVFYILLGLLVGGAVGFGYGLVRRARPKPITPGPRQRVFMSPSGLEVFLDAEAGAMLLRDQTAELTLNYKEIDALYFVIGQALGVLDRLRQPEGR